MLGILQFILIFHLYCNYIDILEIHYKINNIFIHALHNKEILKNNFKKISEKISFQHKTKNKVIFLMQQF